MTADKINLTKLRELAGRADEGFLATQLGREEIDGIYDALPALIDAVEAAREHSELLELRNEQIPDRLRQALDRFTPK